MRTRNFLVALSAANLLFMTASSAFAQAKEKLENKLQVIGLRCPNPNNANKLELISKNPTGYEHKIVAAFEYKSKIYRPSSIEIYTKTTKTPWERIFYVDLFADNSEADQNTSGKALAIISRVQAKICDGTQEAKVRFYKFLNNNSEALNR